MPMPGLRLDRIAVLVAPGVRLYDYAVATEVFGGEHADPDGPATELWTCAASRSPVEARPGVRITPDRGLDALAEADLVVVPGFTDAGARVGADALAALRGAHEGGTAVASLCLGAFVLGRAGLLDGRRATTHWEYADALAREFPAAHVEPGALFVEDAGVWTSAGVAAGTDLCLHLVRTARGATAASALARSMVTPAHRDGGQAQYIPTPVPPADGGTVPAAVRAWALTRLGEPLTVADLAQRAAMSERTFARRFVAETGTSPWQWLLGQRVRAAQELLEGTALSVEEVARTVGFADAAALRPHFARQVGTTPRAYRGTFRGGTGAMAGTGPGAPTGSDG